MATPAIGGSTSGIPKPATRPTGRLGTEEFHSAALPVAQEAAVLYAANHADAAIALLKAEIRDAMGRNNKQAWLMLLDLYQVAADRAEYDALSMLFTVKFEQSPPAWVEAGPQGGDPRRTQSRERKDLFVMKPTAEGELAAQVERFLAFATEQGSARLDLGKVATIGAEDAALLTAALQKLRRARMPMWFNHLDGFEKVLRAAFNERATEDQRPFWLLLFELHVLQGKMEEFEELGLEYAVAFEISPPSWEVYVNTISAAARASAEPRPEAAAGAPEAGFELKGVVSAASANQVAELNAHAASRNEVVVDMGKVMRVDFAYTSAFFDVIKSIQLAGKRVILTNLSELNAALLEALGVNRYAILVRRKST
jgi:anti-anti-sigma regulatory factor